MTPFIVAEMSANHLGSLKRAHQIVEAAAAAGADAIKLQTWVPDTMCIDTKFVLAHGPWAGRRLVDLYREAYTPWEWHGELFDHARQLGLVPFSAAFDCASVDFLESLGVDRHKVASFELTDLPLIRYMASKGKPMILSTGMATRQEIDAAVACVWSWHVPVTERNQTLTLLKCTSAYPADSADANLAVLYEERDKYDPEWGLSDHTMGVGVACAAAALGAVMIEKHLTLSRADGGPDAGFSMEPAEFAQMVVECRRAAAAVGEVRYGPGPNESTALRRSLWVSQHVKFGEPLVLGVNVVTARPALGLSPSTCLRGKVATGDLNPGQPLTKWMLS